MRTHLSTDCENIAMTDDTTTVDHPRTVGMRDLRATLATHLRRAGSGDRLVVTIDGRAIAQLGPVGDPSQPSLADLIAAGLIEPPRRLDRPPAPAAAELAIGVATARVLEEIRGR